MKKVAENKSCSHTREVKRSRKDKERLTIDGVLKFEDGQYSEGKLPINIKLVISEKDLPRLYSNTFCETSDFSWQFSLVLADAIKQIAKGARGKNKGNETTLFWIKTDAGCLYVFFSYWCKKKIQDWPEYLQRLVSIANDEGCNLKDTKGRRYAAREMTEYCIEKYYGEYLRRHGLKQTDDSTNFYITYIHPQLKECRKQMKELIESNANPFDDPTLGPIFRNLKIL